MDKKGAHSEAQAGPRGALPIHGAGEGEAAPLQQEEVGVAPREGEHAPPYREGDGRLVHG